MKKIGIIDYFLSEWHANHLPDWIRRECADGGYDFEISYAYAALDKSPYDGISTDEWCDKFQIKKCKSAEELTEMSDFIIVLAPDNPEMHEILSNAPLRSGKRVYIDKTFAPDADCARRMFAKAKEYGSSLFSSSALRFCSEIDPYRSIKADSAIVCGPGSFKIYAVHIAELINCVMKNGAARIMSTSNSMCRNAVIEYSDGRRAVYVQHERSEAPFTVTCNIGDKNEFHEVRSDFFNGFTKSLLNFFNDGKLPVKEEETVEVMKILDALTKSMQTPDIWVAV